MKRLCRRATDTRRPRKQVGRGHNAAEGSRQEAEEPASAGRSQWYVAMPLYCNLWSCQASYRLASRGGCLQRPLQVNIQGEADGATIRLLQLFSPKSCCA